MRRGDAGGGGEALMLPDVTIAVGDALPSWSQTFLGDEGNEFPLTGFTVVLNAQDQGRVNPVIAFAVAVTNTPRGNPSLCTVDWGSGSTAYAALYDAEFVATRVSDGKTITMRRDPPYLVEFRARV